MKRLTRKELNSLRIVVTMAGPGANGKAKVVLDVDVATLATLTLYKGGVSDYDFEDADTGAYFRLCASFPKVDR